MSASPLDEWLASQPSLKPYLDFDCVPAKPSKLSIFPVRRDRIHKRLRSDLTDFLTLLRKRQDSLFSELSSLAEEPVRIVGHVWFSDPSHNFRVRRLTFAHRVLSTLKTDGLNSQLAAILHKQEDCNALLAAISPDSNLIPSDSGFSVKREFFEIPNPVSPSQDFEVQALAHFVKTENSEISHFPPPKWSGDFPHFLDDLLQKATPHLEKSLSYACPLPEELDLSRYCYEGGNPQFRSEVDESIDRFLPDAPAEFLRWAISIALSLIPRYEQRPLTDQSVGLMMFFRVIFDRVYERRRRLWLPDPHDEARILEQIAVLPTRLHEFPVNDLTPEELALPIRTYFKSAQFFGGAAEFLSEIVFLTNPIDALYSVHRALRLINKAALLKRLANKGSATETDLKKVLGFDDLFSLLVGVVLASDVPDFFEVAKYIDAFAPKNCLSNSFEFALAAVAALSVHFTSLNVDELRARLEP